MAFLDGGRLAADGLPFSDLSAVRTAIAAGERWYAAWAARSLAYENLANQGEDESQTSRGEWLWLGAMMAHAGQLYWFEDVSEKRTAESRRSGLYRLAAPHLQPPARPVSFEVPDNAEASNDFDVLAIEGFLRQPAGQPTARWPCAILLGGLDSTKEESRLFEDLLLARGVATFTFDGPGQGETARRVPLGPSFGAWVSAALSALEGIDSLEADRIGVVGRSLGGSYALEAAASDPRLKACLSWSPIVSGSSFAALPAGIQRTFRYACGESSESDTERIVRGLIDATRDVAAMACPTLVCHGGRDHIVPPADQLAMRDAATDAVRTVFYPEGRHCCHNLAPWVRPQLADWLSSRLGALEYG